MKSQVSTSERKTPGGKYRQRRDRVEELSGPYTKGGKKIHDIQHGKRRGTTVWKWLPLERI